MQKWRGENMPKHEGYTHAFTSARQTGNVQHEPRWREESLLISNQLTSLPLLDSLLVFSWSVRVLVTTAAVWEQGLYWTQAAVGTMDATTPTPAPGPVPAGIHLGTWGSRSAGLNAPYPTTQQELSALSSHTALSANRTTFLSSYPPES